MWQWCVKRSSRAVVIRSLARSKADIDAELARDHIQTGSEFILMRRDRRWKVVTYLDDTAGELYDLQADPQEVHNLWDDASLRPLRDELVAGCTQ